MLTRDFILRVHRSAYIHRWNDHLRPEQGFQELDKQAHKMVISFFLAKIEECIFNEKVDYRHLIEGGLAQFFHRIELTDIKPPIFHRLIREKGKELNDYVVDHWEKDLSQLEDKDFFERFKAHLDEDLEEDLGKRSLEHRILGAAHYLATKWEFDLIYAMNCNLYGIEATRDEVNEQFEHYKFLSSVQYILVWDSYQKLFNLIGQLRFQQRWTQTVRIPPTSVLGHSLVVAILAYFVSLERGLAQDEAVLNFWQGLFHDIPEVLTRDIISPVKQGVGDLENIIKEIEKEEIEKRLFPLLRDEKVKEQFWWFLENEFEMKESLQGKVDGGMIKHCDMYAAYVEASLSLQHGVRSSTLLDAQKRIAEKLSQNSGYPDSLFSWRVLLDYFPTGM